MGYCLSRELGEGAEVGTRPGWTPVRGGGFLEGPEG